MQLRVRVQGLMKELGSLTAEGILKALIVKEKEEDLEERTRD